MTPTRRLALLCAVMIFGSLGFGVITGVIGVHQEMRYYIYLLPFFFLPVVYVVKVIPGWINDKDIKIQRLWTLIIAGGIILAFLIPLPTYYTTDQRDNWRSAEELTHGSPRMVVPTFNQIPLEYYSHENESGYTYYSEVPGNFSGYVIVGPAGGYDPPMQAWFEGLPVYRNVTGITIYHTRG
jgi:hypothetical protein